DAHELESEKTGLRGLRRRLARATERLLIRYADLVIVVSETIAQWYATSYRIRPPLVVRNVPAEGPVPVRFQESPLRSRCGVGDDVTVFLYVGVLGPGRSIERLCRVFAKVSPERHLVLMGYGALEEFVAQCARRHPNIHFLPAVPPSEVRLYIRGADVGCCLIEEVSLSYRFSLPNKLFQCIVEGVPVIVNDLPEQASFVSRGCGWV